MARTSLRLAPLATFGMAPLAQPAHAERVDFEDAAHLRRCRISSQALAPPPMVTLDGQP
jgi:hypothetical protein